MKSAFTLTFTAACLISNLNGQTLSFAPASIISQAGHSGTASSEGANLDDDANIEFITTATASTSDAHFRVYDYNPISGVFDIIAIRSDSDINSRPNRFGGDITTADMNDDGYADIVLPISNNNNGYGYVSWFENPDGVLSDTWVEHVVEIWDASSNDEKVRHMSEIDVGDVDGNGYPDIVTRDVSHGIYIMLRNDTDTAWLPRIFIDTNPREGLDLFNPDGDNDLDIIINGVWYETPADPQTGTYTQHTYGADWYPSGGNSAQVDDYACQIAIADFNKDTRIDIAITNSEELDNDASTDSKPKGIRVYLAPADPKTQAWTEIIVETQHFSWHSMEIADLNGDTYPDFISAISTVGADNANPQLVAFINNGSGTAFTKQSLSDSPEYIYNSSVGDADNDGDDDLFAPYAFNEGPIRYYENTTENLPQDTTPPSAPSNVSAMAISSSEILLNWEAASDDVAVFGYKIYLDSVFYVSLTELSYVLTDLDPSTEYTIEVSAVDTSGNESAFSESDSASTFVLSPIAGLDMADSLLAFWSFDEGSGTTVDEPIGNFDGSLTGSSWTSSGKISNALVLAGGTDRVGIDPPTATEISVSGTTLSLAAWVKHSSFQGAGNNAHYISKATGNTDDNAYWVMGNNGDGTGVRFSLKTADSISTKLTSANGTIALDTWHHVVATYDGAKMRLYVDGEFVVDTAKTGNISAGTDVPLGLGNLPPGNGGRGLFGELDEVRVYDKTLDLDEVQALFEQTEISGSDGTPGSIGNNGASGSGGEVVDYTGSHVPGATPSIEFEGGSFSIVFTRDYTNTTTVRTPELSLDLSADEPWSDGLSQIEETYLGTEGDYHFIRATSTTTPTEASAQFMRVRTDLIE